jgi:hypothetical protein
MNTQPPNEETILEQALSFASPEARQAFLKGACGGDEALRARVQSLIEAHEAAGGFLADKVTEGVPTVPIGPQLDERPGTMIGRYKLLEEFGEDGCGVMHMAGPVRLR